MSGAAGQLPVSKTLGPFASQLQESSVLAAPGKTVRLTALGECHSACRVALHSIMHSLALTTHILHLDAGTCFNGECEGLHLPPDERAEQATWAKPSRQKIIVTAGISNT